MQRHIIDHAKDRNGSRRLAAFARQERAPRRIDDRSARYRGAARLAQFLRIARGRRA